MQRAEYKRVDVWGLNVRYVDTGEPGDARKASDSREAGDGPVVLLLHGLADSLLSWYCNIDALADAGFRVIAPDLPGFGDSDKPDHLEYDPVSAAEFVYDLSQVLKLDKFSLVGNSAGGLISGLFALENPDMVEKMALVCSGGFGRKVSWLLRAISIPVLGNLVYQPWFNSQIGITKRLFHQPPEILDELLPEMDRMKLLPGAKLAVLHSIRSTISLRGIRKEAYILERLKDSKVPLLTVWGENDRIIPVNYAEDVHRELPHSEVQVIPECGHWPQMEKPEQFNPMLISFLKGDSAQTTPDQP
jgi:pimeloyl-ACP methyl ester carboxylesterase